MSVEVELKKGGVISAPLLIAVHEHTTRVCFLKGNCECA